MPIHKKLLLGVCCLQIAFLSWRIANRPQKRYCYDRSGAIYRVVTGDFGYALYAATLTSVPDKENFFQCPTMPPECDNKGFCYTDPPCPAGAICDGGLGDVPGPSGPVGAK